MNEQLQQALAEILSKTMVSIEAGTTFMQAELPDVIQQLLTWKLASSFLIFIIASIVFSLCLLKLKRLAPDAFEYQRGSSLYYNNSGELEAQGRKIMQDKAASLPFFFIWATATIITGLVFIIEGLPAAGVSMKIWLAPKIYLIEYAASVVK